MPRYQYLPAPVPRYQYDTDGSGFIEADELKVVRLFQQLNEKFTMGCKMPPAMRFMGCHENSVWLKMRRFKCKFFE